jgi:hypothetical protein
MSLMFKPISFRIYSLMSSPSEPRSVPTIFGLWAGNDNANVVALTVVIHRCASIRQELNESLYICLISIT